MFRKNKKYIFLLATCLVLLIVAETLAPKPVNWNPDYQKHSDIPYGTSALFSLLPSVFPGQEITTTTVPAYNILQEANADHLNYIFINHDFACDKLDTRELLEFAEKGNSVFISAYVFEGKLADTLKLKSGAFSGGFDQLLDTSFVQSAFRQDDTVTINYSSPKNKNPKGYLFKKGFEDVYFKSFDTARTIILGENEYHQPNYIRCRWGKGAFYLNTVPKAFANYHFVGGNNHEYAIKALSFLPLQNVLWDEYYKAGNVIHESSLKVILNNVALRNAFFLLMCTLLAFLLIGSKRRQRAIPELDPMRNTTLQFVDVVGTLYFQTGDHHNIAVKKISYFMEFLRTRFQVKTVSVDTAMIARVSNLSGIPSEKISEMFAYFKEISSKAQITQQELLKLNKIIEDFYTENKR
jgi:hypothetical protein